MARVLFVTWDGGGNVPPALEIAAELRARGDVVIFLGHERQRRSIEKRGYTFHSYASDPSWSVIDARRGIRGLLDYAALFTNKKLGDDVREVVARESIDYAVVDGLLLGAIAGAARIGLQYAVLVHTLFSVMDATFTRGPLALIPRLRGLNPRRLYGGAELLLVATLPELDPAASGADPRVIHVGPTVTGVASTPEQPPVVLVSLSTTFIDRQQEALQQILDTLAPLEVRAVVMTGEAVSATMLNPPPNAEVHEFLPHSDVMPGASLLITHGGHATTMVALAHGLPMLVLPMAPHFDQPTIARIIEQQGAGLALPKTAKAPEIRAAVTRVLGEPSYRAAAEGLGARIREQDAAAAAADALGAAITR